MNAYQYPAAPPSYAGTPTDPTAVMGRRTVAWIIDFLIWFLLSLFLGPTPLNPLAEYVDTGGVVGIDCQDIQDSSDVASCVEIGDRLYFLDGSDVTISLVVLWILAPLAYVALMGATGRTPGMALLGVKVVNEQGDNPGFGKSFIRTVLWIVDGIPCIIPLVGFITGLTTTGHRRVGDMAAKTFVVGKAHSGPVVVPGLTTAGGAGYPTPYGPPGQQQAWGAPGPAGVGGPPGAGGPPPAGQQPAWGAPSAPPPGAQPGSWGTPSGGFPVPGATPSPDSPPPGQPGPPAAAPGWAPPGVRQPSGETPSGETPSAAPSPAGSPTSPTSPTSPRSDPVASSRDSGPAPADARSERPSAAPSPTEPPRGSAAATGGTGSAPSGESPAADAPTSREPTGPATPGPATSGAAAAAGAAGGATPPGESPAAQSAPSSYNPQWDAARGTYIVWEPNRGKWLGWDEAAQEWKPL